MTSCRTATPAARRRFDKLPWLDYGGRFSPLKAAVFVALFLPLASIAWRYGQNDLGAQPLHQAIHEVGSWTLKLILLSLAVKPARRILRWPRLILVRRMVGVAAFAYAATHLLLYIANQAFDLVKVTEEIALRFYLTIGFVALLILAAMAATSTDGMMRRLGGVRWRRPHRLIYFGAFLAIIHFFLQTKANVNEPWIMAGLYGWLMGYRLLALRYGSDSRTPLWAIAALALAAGLATALGEAVYYSIKLDADPGLILAADLSLETGVRPAWVALMFPLAMTALGALRSRQAGRARSLSSTTSRRSRPSLKLTA